MGFRVGVGVRVGFEAMFKVTVRVRNGVRVKVQLLFVSFRVIF